MTRPAVPTSHPREQEHRRQIARALNQLPQIVAAVDDLGQTISATPTQAEVQAISDKVDELLAAMRTAGVLAT